LLERQHQALRPAVAPIDEQPWLEVAEPAPLVERLPSGRLASATAARALARRPRRTKFLPRNVACDPRFAVHNQRRLEWLKKRRTELFEMTGGLSHAVQAMLNAAAWLYAGGDFASELAAETGNLDFFKTAANLTATARTHDMGAWELAVREGEARKAASASASDPLAGFRVKP